MIYSRDLFHPNDFANWNLILKLRFHKLDSYWKKTEDASFFLNIMDFRLNSLQ